jgi:hypothetical protein
MNYIYSLIIIVILFLIFKVYIKVKYKFWAYQPVFHYYNLYYWIKPKGIIDTELPKTNKYCNFYNVCTKEFSECDKNTLNEIITFIRTSYYRNKNANYLPTESSFSSYFIGNNTKTFISTYYRSITIDTSQDISTNMSFITNKELLGVMTGRPVNITLKNQETFRAHYIDYLCVHNEHRKKGIAPEIIQTHEYNQRHRNKKIGVSLFKREGELTGIVALTTYNTYQFDINMIPRGLLPHVAIQLIEINKLNIRLLTTFIQSQKTKFECFVLPDLTNLLNLVTSNTYKIYGLREKDKLIAVYFFRNSYMSYDLRSEKEKENNEDREKETKKNSKNSKKSKKEICSIECFASINDTIHEIFIAGFSLTLYKYSKMIKAKLITIENIGNNNIIINHIFLLNIIPRIVSPTAYFYYNYAKRPILPEKAMIIC